MKPFYTSLTFYFEIIIEGVFCLCDPKEIFGQAAHKFKNLKIPINYFEDILSSTVNFDKARYIYV